MREHLTVHEAAQLAGGMALLPVYGWRDLGDGRQLYGVKGRRTWRLWTERR